jgi:hypothetical protein
MTAFIIGWYVFCAILGTAIWLMIRGMMYTKYRDPYGDATTEVGYMEDSQGRHIARGPDLACTQLDPFRLKHRVTHEDGFDGDMFDFDAGDMADMGVG